MLCAISDLHMGNGRAPDRFGHGEGEFLRFLDFLESRYEKIVLVGDVYETQHGVLFGGFARELARCRRARPRIDERLRGPRYQWVHGNHDEVLAKVEGVPDRLRIEVEGVRLLFLHGHQFDLVVGHAPLASHLSTWAGARLARQGIEAGLAFLDWLDDRLGGLSPDPARCRYQALAFEYLARDGADVLVMGHTHLPVVSRRGEKTYVNSGACILGRFDYAHLDPARACYEVRRWEP